VGVKILDEQHKCLLGIFNDLHAAMTRGRGLYIAPELLRKLKKCMHEHHSAEEKLMEETNFPMLAQHREDHRKFLAILDDFVLRHEAGDNSYLRPLLYALKEWHDNHLLQCDREYIPHLAARGISSLTPDQVREIPARPSALR
jgi:hemerythrin